MNKLLKNTLIHILYHTLQRKALVRNNNTFSGIKSSSQPGQTEKKINIHYGVVYCRAEAGTKEKRKKEKKPKRIKA